MKSRAEYRRELKKELKRLSDADLTRVKDSHPSHEVRAIAAQILKERAKS
jgi:hypothetical protein